MRRKDREISDIEQTLHIMSTIKVCRLGLFDGSNPYIVPLNYGFTYESQQITLYFHSALTGKKIDILKTNPQVCFEVDGDHQLIQGTEADDVSFDFVSIMGTGCIEFIDDQAQKINAMKILLNHQIRSSDLTCPKEVLDKVQCYRLTVSEWTVKKHKTVSS